jgi:hypothetical protein
LGELYFNEDGLEKGQTVELFRENELVVFEAEVSTSQKHKDKLRAIKVKLLSDEMDLTFLLGHFLSILKEKDKYSDYKLIQIAVHANIISQLEKIADEQIIGQLFQQYQTYLNSNLQSQVLSDESYIRGLLKICKSLFPSYYSVIVSQIENKVSPKIAHNLWLDNFTETCQIDFIAGNILSSTPEVKQSIFTKCSEEDKSNIFFKVLYGFEKIDTELKLKTIKEFLKLSKEFAPEQHSKILSASLDACPDHFRLNLWLEDYHEVLDFDLFKIHIITLAPQDQKKFVKKVLKYIHEGKSTVSVEAFTSINTIDYEISKLVEEQDKSHLDYSTSIILNVISELQSHTKLETKAEKRSAQLRIYNLILKQIKDPKDILEITGYFDECGGRSTISVEEMKNESGDLIDPVITYHRNENNKAKRHPFCDGRKAIDKITKQPILSATGNVEYWWCANQQCFEPSRRLHESKDWEKYTLLDFLSILKIEYDLVGLEMYLSIINKANRFLKHLSCRECNHILYPNKGQSKFAFYGITRFACKNEECSKKNNEIYLSHCLNGLCEMEIDSRDSVKCVPKGVLDPQSCGWYVCNNCHACCNSNQLQRVKWRYDNLLKEEYKCHLDGHRDLGVLSCNKCGNAMDDSKFVQEEYTKVLDWFIANKENSSLIASSGKRRDEKWWFRLKRNRLTQEEFRKKLNHLLILGFRIPDFEEEKGVYLITEGNRVDEKKPVIFVCSNAACKNILDLSTDLEKAKAITRFHNVRFVKEPVNPS